MRRGASLICFLTVLIIYLLLISSQFRSDAYKRKAKREAVEPRKSAESMEMAVHIDPEDAEAWANLGAIYHILSNEDPADRETNSDFLGKAEKAYLKAIQHAPTESSHHMSLGLTRFQLAQLAGSPTDEEVRKSFERATSLDSFNYYTHYLLGDYLLYADNQADALEQFRLAIRAYPHDEVIMAVLKKTMKNTTRYEELEQVVPEGIALAHHYLARSLWEKLHLWPESKEQFQIVLRLEPVNLYFRNFYLNYCFSAGDIPAVLGEMEERTRLGLPENLETWMKVARFLKDKGEFDKAMDVCERVKNRNPNDPEALMLMAEIRGQAGELVEAVNLYRAQIKAHPENPEGFYRLGQIYRKHGNTYRAVELFNSAAFLAPEHEAFQNALADAYETIGMLDRALETYAKCKSINPGALYPFLKSGEILLKKEDWLEAAHEFNQALKVDSSHAEALQGFLQARANIP